LELGVFLGCQEFGGKNQSGKRCLILDRNRHRYRKSISDLSGRDIRAHDGNAEQAIRHVRDWLVTEAKLDERWGGRFIFDRYRKFKKQLPKLCAQSRRHPGELTFAEY